MESRILIGNITRELEISESAARLAIGQLLGFVTQHADAGIAKSLLAQIPWAHELIGRVRVPPLTEAAITRMHKQVSAMGNHDLRDIVTGLGLSGALKRTGLTEAQIGRLFDLFLAFVSELAGESLARRILAEIPDLDPLAAWPRRQACNEQEAQTCLDASLDRT